MYSTNHAYCFAVFRLPTLPASLDTELGPRYGIVNWRLLKNYIYTTPNQFAKAILSLYDSVIMIKSISYKCYHIFFVCILHGMCLIRHNLIDM